jgi:hypothetical protein
MVGRPVRTAVSFGDRSMVALVAERLFAEPEILAIVQGQADLL